MKYFHVCMHAPADRMNGHDFSSDAGEVKMYGRLLQHRIALQVSLHGHRQLGSFTVLETMSRGCSDVSTNEFLEVQLQ